MDRTKSLAILFACALAAGSVFVGCGGQPKVSVEPVETPFADTAKSVLEPIVESGEVGSGIEELRMALEELQSTDSAKASEWLADLSELESASGSAAQAKAKEMLGKL